MGAAKRKTKTRKDYRTAQLGTIQHYILEVYPERLDYSWKDLAGWYSAHSGWERTTPINRMAMTALEGQQAIPWAQFQAAIQEIQASEHTTPPGRTLVATLQWYQRARWNKMRGFTIQKFAQELGADVGTVSRWRDRCIELITQIVLKPDLD